jgi:protein FAM50
MGDFQANFARPDAGIRTVEGNVAGNRAAQMEKKRKLDQETFEARKRAVQEEKVLSLRKFSGAQENDTSLKSVGLVTAQEFKELAAANKEQEELEGRARKESEAELRAREKAARKARKKKLAEKQKLLSTLSFANEQDFQEEEEEESLKLSKKDPTVDTSFLPDKARDEQAVLERQRLSQEWKERQEQIKQEKLEITYSYWDGSGHRRTLVCTKGDAIADFLEQVRNELSKDFRELGSISSDALLYVKEDLIIPQDMTFYDLIVSKARGKSGPLFCFDVHDDIRVGAIDSRVEKDESHPGKVVERRWYERNKHIFPASRWEVYDPTQDYGSYTIGGGEVQKKG